MQNKSFQGIIPPVTTPFDGDGGVLWDALENNLVRYNQDELGGVLLLGSNSEAVHLSLEEKQEIIRLGSGLVAADRPLIVGAMEGSLYCTLRFLDSLSDCRMDYCLAGVPSYFRSQMTEPVLADYFVQLADQSPAPVLLYNVPQFSGLELSPRLVGELSAHPRIVGMKDSSGNLLYLQRVQGHLSGEFSIILGSAQILGPAALLGVQAAILAIACALPELSLEVLRDVEQGRASSRSMRRLFDLAEAVTTQYGVAGLKHLMDLAGRHGGSCRRPLPPLSAAGREAIETMFRSSQTTASPRIG